ncbi:MAG: LVIVD repeat-containing protein, partial [Granulosicoccaceae bacterium]
MKFINKAKSFVLASAALFILTGCETNTSSSNSNGNTDSTAGSRARMALIGDYLYAISGEDVQLLDISTPASPNFWNRIQLDWDIETLFPYGDYLLVGSETGVHILDNSVPGSPQYLSEFSHARACDPVVAANDIAYVTLNSSRNCWLQTASNQLDVLDLSDMSNPTLIKTYPMQEPTGLAVKDQWLFVC